jgi:hypothetical protein
MRQTMQSEGAPQLGYYKQVWDKQRIGTILDRDENEAIVRKEQKRKLAEEQANKNKQVANDILEKIRNNNFRGSSLLTAG